MINHPPLTELMDMVDCRYTLVVETAKRAGNWWIRRNGPRNSRMPRKSMR